MFKQLRETLPIIQKQKPIILCLTNSVTQDFVANSLLAIGASPIMSNCKEELEELIKIAHALYINIGTLNNDFIIMVQYAVKLSKLNHKPIILDPVGSGVSQIRTDTAWSLFTQADIIRGNAGEIASLVDSTFVNTGGIDGNIPIQDDFITLIQKLSIQCNNTIIISGIVDQIFSHHNYCQLAFGSPLMSQVTGMGCSLTAIIAAFTTVIKDNYQAAQLAVLYFTLCGELAQEQCHTPANFKVVLLDTLFNPHLQKLENLYKCKI